MGATDSLQDQLNAEFNQMPEVPNLPSFTTGEEIQETELDGGFEPANNKVVVLPDYVPRYSAGGIAIPDDITEREEMAQIFAVLVAVGPDAWKDRKTQPAAPGDRVMIAKFVGQLFTGPDGRRYRVIHDLDIIGKVTKKGVRK